MNYDKIQITENEDFFDTWHTKNYYLDYLAVNENEKWNWEPVYENQKNDVHPPLYYLLLRICAMFTINSFTKWTGLALNIIIWVGSCILIYFISEKIMKDKFMALLTCLVSGLTLGALDTTAYIRMYELANFFVLLISFLHLRLYDEEDIKAKKLIPLGISILLGSLTHYYVIVYTALLFIMFVIKYIRKKQYKNLRKYIICFAIAAILSIAIFPHSLSHMFGGYRGEEAKNNLFNLESVFSNLGLYLYIISKNIFAQTAVIVIIAYIILYAIKKKIPNEENLYINLLVIPSIIYFVLISQISSYKELRYMMPIISVLCICAIYFFYQIIKKYVKEKKAKIITTIVFCLIIISPALTNTGLEFTYKKMNNLSQKMESMKEVPALYIFNENNIRFLDDITIFTKLNESYIMKSSNATIENVSSVLKNKKTNNGLIVVYNEGVEPDKIVKQIMERYNYNKKEEVQKLNCGMVLYLK